MLVSDIVVSIVPAAPLLPVTAPVNAPVAHRVGPAAVVEVTVELDAVAGVETVVTDDGDDVVVPEVLGLEEQAASSAPAVATTTRPVVVPVRRRA